jgi:hypothetical protein
MKNRQQPGKPCRAAKLDEVTHVTSSLRKKGGRAREVPTIILRGDWLKALGFPVGAPIYLFAEAHGRMVICRLGLHKPRWLRIVAPKGTASGAEHKRSR